MQKEKWNRKKHSSCGEVDGALKGIKLKEISLKLLCVLGMLFLLNLQANCYGGTRALSSLADVPDFARLFLIVFGLALMCAGFHIYMFFIGLAGFVVGVLLGFVGFHELHPAIAFAIAILLGGIGANLAVLLQWLLVFLSGCLVGATVSLVVFGPIPILIIISACLVGAITVPLWKFFMILFSSALGSMAFCVGSNTIHTVWFPILLTIVGVGIQYQITKKVDEHKARGYGELFSYHGTPCEITHPSWIPISLSVVGTIVVVLGYTALMATLGQ
ncbi:hypothetical protein ACFL3Q_03465 [Planctomycetota bacterium]